MNISVFALMLKSSDDGLSPVPRAPQGTAPKYLCPPWDWGRVSTWNFPSALPQAGVV